MKILELRSEYEEQLEKLEKRLGELNEEVVNGKGTPKYHLRKKIRIYTEMINDCNYAIRKMTDYCEGEKPIHSLRVLSKQAEKNYSKVA